YRHLRLAFLGVIRTCQNTRRLSRALKQGGRIKSFTISPAGGSWYASLLVETPAAATPPQPTRAARVRGEISVDLGVHVMAATSDGQSMDNPAPGKKAVVRLKKLQRRLARSWKGSARRKRLVAQISRAHHTVALQRETAAHEMTKRLVTGYSLVAIEDLNVAGMTASAAGTIETPGKNVRAKSGLNRAVLDVAPGMIRRQLEYKASWHGARVEVIDRYAPSSKTCSNCGAVKTKLSLSERVYRCRQCGVVIDRDINNAIKILAFARGDETGTGRHHQLACGKRERVNGRGAYRRSRRTRWELPAGGRGSVKTVPAGAATVPEQSDTHPYNQLRENQSGPG
ncbi:MAG: transposase, partial [Kocuria sp.]|nr:transposase [Kocuria sp.]